jgi:protein-tyrosine phosphatase
MDNPPEQPMAVFTFHRTELWYNLSLFAHPRLCVYSGFETTSRGEEQLITHIVERIAIGTVSDAQSTPEHITAFLNLAEEIDVTVEDKLYHKVPIKDFAPISPAHMSEAILWIGEHVLHHEILIFCNAGIQRSPSIVIAYLCSIGFGYDEALRFVTNKKLGTSPVPNLMQSIEDCLNFYL